MTNFIIENRNTWYTNSANMFEMNNEIYLNYRSDVNMFECELLNNQVPDFIQNQMLDCIESEIYKYHYMTQIEFEKWKENSYDADVVIYTLEFKIQSGDIVDVEIHCFYIEDYKDVEIYCEEFFKVQLSEYDKKILLSGILDYLMAETKAYHKTKYEIPENASVSIQNE